MLGTLAQLAPASHAPMLHFMIIATCFITFIFSKVIIFLFIYRPMSYTCRVLGVLAINTALSMSYPWLSQFVGLAWLQVVGRFIILLTILN